MIGIIKRILNRLIKSSYWYNNVVFQDCRKFWNHRSYEIEIVNLGSTSARSAFNYTDINMQACNWAMMAQSLSVDYEILRNYSCYLKDDAFVIISICPFSCIGGYNVDFPDKYYTILNISSIPHASFVRKQRMISLMQFPFSSYPLIELCSFHKKESFCPDFEKDALNRMNSWKHEFSIIDWEYPLAIVNKDNYEDSVETLRKIVEYCHCRGLKPIIVLPPVAKELSAFFTLQMKKLFIYDFVSKSAPDIPFFNYMDDNKFKDPSIFKNSFELNSHGSKLFTNHIIKEIIK